MNEGPDSMNEDFPGSGSILQTPAFANLFTSVRSLQAMLEVLQFGASPSKV